MREIALFVEDYAHQQIIGALVRRIAVESRNAHCGSLYLERNMI